MTQVVRLKRSGGQIVQGCDVYIGRAMNMGGWNLTASKWANPFPITSDCPRLVVLQKYETWIKSKPELLVALDELDGKVLGCWCKPQACHGDILIRLLEEKKKSKKSKDD